MPNVSRSVPRNRVKTLGVPELIAIALGGMVGGGIFTILGISVAMVGAYTPLVMIIGGVIASFAAYSYVKLGVYYRDEGATYSFFKRTFPHSAFAASLIGWWVIFGYISTISLYAYTFASYALSGTGLAGEDFARKLVACGIIAVFTLVNVWSVRGMGKLEDAMVYTKLAILSILSFTLINHAELTVPQLFAQQSDVSVLSILIVSSITFVAFEGFQLVINAVNEMDEPERNIPKTIYTAIVLAVLIYFVISLGAILAIPFSEIIANKEFALAAGASHELGHWGKDLVVAGALLATSSAISGTAFGASRQMAVIAKDGYFPKLLGKRRSQIPINAILAMGFCASVLILLADLEMILEFGSVTFLVVSLLMAYANFRIRDKTKSSTLLTLLAIAGLALGTGLIFYYEYTTQPEQLLFILGLYLLLTLCATVYAKYAKRQSGTVS